MTIYGTSSHPRWPITTAPALNEFGGSIDRAYMTFYRAYAYLAAPFLLLAVALSLAFDFGFGLLSSTIAAMILAAIAAGVVVWFSHKVGTFAAMVYTG